jgi:creatinine amidohydrolase
MQKVAYELMYPAELEQAIDACPVAYVPCGLLEWHSTYLPLGTDGLKMEELGRRIAMKHGGVVLPPFYVGMPGYSSFQGTLTYTRETVYRVFLETFGELGKIGFKVIVALGGHYGKPQERTLKAAAAAYEGEGKARVWVLHESEVVEELGIGVDHAGPWETSMGIELIPDLVDLSNFRPGLQNPKIYSLPERSGRFSFEYGASNLNIDQDLRTSLDPEEISEKVSLIVDRIGLRVQELLASRA